MWNIIKLDPALANQISAWEVVERPFSVIKELFENSVDAWATSISVEIEWWWIEKMCINDNGSWIAKDDLEMVLEKYTTSKIKSLEDLHNIMTFWFRWEALASISSVSRFEIISKIWDSAPWYSLKCIDGKSLPIETCPSENGTKIVVENLFYNTPARLNYLKTARTEYSHIADFLKQASLSYPEIWISFVSDWKTIFQYRSWETIETRIYNVYWETFFENLLSIDFEMQWIHIHGYISDPKVSFGSNKKQSLFVNKRIIKSPLVFKAIQNAYNRFIPHWQHPWYVLHIDIDPTQVDVNVHPRKLEVRFANESTVFKSIYNSIQSRLDWVSLLSDSNSLEIWKVMMSEKWDSDMWTKYSSRIEESSPKYYTGSWTKFKSYSPYTNTAPNPSQWQISSAIKFSKAIAWNNDVSFTPKDASSIIDIESTDLSITPIGRIIWQLHNSYIVVETLEWLKILDQHALAERVIYERLVRNDNSLWKQWLLVAESISVSEKEKDIIDKYKDTFESMWFELETLSNWIVLINAIPDFIKKDNIASILQWIILDVWQYWHCQSLTLEEIKNKIYAYTSCRSAIKFWHKLSLFEMNALLKDSLIDYSSTCPHWRPVVYEIWLEDLKNKYER